MNKPTRVHRIPVVNKSRAGIRYISYKNPSDIAIPQSFAPFIPPKQSERKTRRGAGRSFPNGHYLGRAKIIMVLTKEGKTWLRENPHRRTIPRKYLTPQVIHPEYK